MEEPRTRIVREEPDCDVIASIADGHNIPNDGVDEVVRGVASATDHMEIVSMQMNRVLSGSTIRMTTLLHIICENSQDHRWHHQE
jgi:hypothetical protein